eukprot:Opistho-1_new@44068
MRGGLAPPSAGKGRVGARLIARPPAAHTQRGVVEGHPAPVIHVLSGTQATAKLRHVGRQRGRQMCRLVFSATGHHNLRCLLAVDADPFDENRQLFPLAPIKALALAVIQPGMDAVNAFVEEPRSERVRAIEVVDGMSHVHAWSPYLNTKAIAATRSVHPVRVARPNSEHDPVAHAHGVPGAIFGEADEDGATGIRGRRLHARGRILAVVVEGTPRRPRAIVRRDHVTRIICQSSRRRCIRSYIHRGTNRKWTPFAVAVAVTAGRRGMDCVHRSLRRRASVRYENDEGDHGCQAAGETSLARQQRHDRQLHTHRAETPGSAHFRRFDNPPCTLR